jgi:hypothetical protein
LAAQEPSLRQQEQSLRQRIATEYRRLDPDPERIADLQRERAVLRIAGFAAKVLGAAPPLRDEQRQHLAQVMLMGDADAAA